MTGLQISDATGAAYGAKVDKDYRLHVDSVASSPEHYRNWAYGEAYHVKFSKSPTAADDCIFYMANSDADELVVEGMYLYTSGTCSVYCKVGDKGTRNSATDLTAVNVNAGSGKTASGDFEEGVDLDGGAATLTGGSEFLRWTFVSVGSTDYYNFESDLVLPKNETMTVWADSATPTITGFVVFYYHGTE